MKATELRIGNLFEFNNKQWSVAALDHNSITMYDNSGHTISNIAAEPIPLTEEWLIKFRFKKYRFGSSIWYTKSCGKNKPELITNDIGEDAYSTKLQFVFIDTYDNIKIRHIHKLQNLYFALTGKELKTKTK